MLHPRLAAAAAVVGAGLHLVPDAAHASSIAAVLAPAMAAACLPCAVSLWRKGGAHQATMLMVMSLAIVAVHGFLLTGSLLSFERHSGFAGHAGHPGSSPGVPQPGGPSSAGLMFAVMACDYLAAALSAGWLARLRAANRRRARSA